MALCKQMELHAPQTFTEATTTEERWTRKHDKLGAISTIDYILCTKGIMDTQAWAFAVHRLEAQLKEELSKASHTDEVPSF